MLTEHVDLVFLIVWTVALANIIGAAICYLLTNKLAMITKIPLHILALLALTIVFSGILYSTSDVEGVILLLAFGILGWLAKALDWSRPAILLAFILGPLIETFYFHTTMIYGTAWLLRPSVIVILACACGIIYLGIVLQRKAKKAGVD